MRVSTMRVALARQEDARQGDAMRCDRKTTLAKNTENCKFVVL